MSDMDFLMKIGALQRRVTDLEAELLDKRDASDGQVDAALEAWFDHKLKGAASMRAALVAAGRGA